MKVLALILVWVLLGLAVFFFFKQRNKIKSLKDFISQLTKENEGFRENVDSLSKEIEGLVDSNKNLSERLQSSIAEKNEILTSKNALEAEHSKLTASYKALADENRIIKATANSLQEGIIGIEFEVNSKSKKVAFNKAMMKCGSQIIEAGNVKFIKKENGEEVGILYILKPTSYEDVENTEV